MAAYDAIADWYETKFLPTTNSDADPIGIGGALRELLRTGDGVCVELGYWTKDSWTDRGIRDKVGAMHRPLPDLLHACGDAGLTLERFHEGGAPTPTTLSVRARRI